MKLRFQIIILLMAVSLAGIILVQVFWIRHAIKAEEARFDKTVYNALTTGVSMLERKDMYVFMDKKLELPPLPPAPLDSLIEIEVPEQVDVSELINDSVVKVVKPANSAYLIDDSSRTKHIIRIDKHKPGVIVWESEGDKDSNFNYNYEYRIEIPDYGQLDSLQHKTEKEIQKLEFLSQDQMKKYQYSLELDALQKLQDSLQAENMKRIEIQAKRMEVVRTKVSKFNQYIKEWAYEYSFDDDLLRRLGMQQDIDTIIGRTLKNNGIELAFNSQIVKEDDDTTIVIRSSDQSSTLLDNAYKTELFPNDLYRKDILLAINFPGKSRHILRSVSLLGFGSLLFTIIILITFGMTLYYIQKQKKISEIKSDFINNMTHEFKTPIATISLASDALGSPKVTGKTEQTKYYLDIIRQENKRMNNQVERVLQMALIENHDFQLDLQKTDIHSIIENTINAVELSAKEKKGKIQSSLRASCSEVPVDEIHFANIMNNLLDNALKYCEKEPEILVETYNKDNKIFVRISDNGVGMNKEVQKHIFDKFYRRPSGNIHNVKGFGLGLSYVKAIMDSHGGEITVNSEPGNGSIFTLSLNC